MNAAAAPAGAETQSEGTASGGTPPGGKKGIESGESDPGYESDSTKRKKQQQQLADNTVKLSVAAAAPPAAAATSETKGSSSHEGKMGNPETKSLTIHTGAIYQSKLFNGGSKLSLPPPLPPLNNPMLGPEQPAVATEQPPSLDSAKEEYDNLIEELIEVEEVASQMQELEESRVKDTTSTFPVTMEIFSPVRVRTMKYYHTCMVERLETDADVFTLVAI